MPSSRSRRPPTQARDRSGRNPPLDLRPRNAFAILTRVDLRATQKPLKERYREEADAARITLRAEANRPMSRSRARSTSAGRSSEAQAHGGVGGPGTGACSGDLLLGALAACAQLTCQMVATSMGIETERIEVTAEGDLDLRGTLGCRQGGSGRLRGDPAALRRRCARGERRSSSVAEREDRALLHGPADAVQPPAIESTAAG